MAAQKKNTDFTTKITCIVVGTLLTIFVLGHLSAVLNEGAVESMDFFIPLMDHIKAHPLAFIAFNPYVAYFGGLSYLLFFVISFSKQTVPQAEMKGEEHGSNNFQTPEEKAEFLASNTTPILELDVERVKKMGKGGDA